MRALVFGGQGSLVCELGKDIYETYPLVKVHYDETALKREVRDFVFHDTDLNTKPLAQLGLLQFYMAMTDLIKASNIDYHVSFGLSLGTYGALYSAKALDGNTLFELVKKRSELMASVASASSSGLMAILGVDILEVKAYLDDAAKNGLLVYLANDNAIGQIVVGGSLLDLEGFKEILAKVGKKSILLPVSAAFHTPYMKEAEVSYKEFLKTYTFSAFEKPIIDNRTAKKMEEANLVASLSSHLIEPVKFRESILYTKELGISEYLVIDAGKTIEGFIKKTLGRDAKITILNSVESLQKLM